MKTSQRIKHLFRSHDRWTRHYDKPCHCEGCYVSGERVAAWAFATLGFIVAAVLVFLIAYAIIHNGLGIGKSDTDKQLDFQNEQNFRKHCETLGKAANTNPGTWVCQ